MKFIEHREGDDYVFDADRGDIRVVMGGVRESSGDLTAIVRAYHINGRGPVPLMAPSRLNMIAPRSRTEVAKQIAARHEPSDIDVATWGQVIEYCCGRTYALWEQGEPIINMAEVELPPWSGRYCVAPFLPEGETTIIVADGGSGKSTLATAILTAGMTGATIVPGLQPIGRRQGLYLDWESNKHEHARRLHAICRGAKMEGVPPMLYRTNYRALADDIAVFRKEIVQHEVGFVVVDSAVPASGDDIKDTSAPRQLFNGLRSLGDGVTRLVLAHMSKAEAGKETGRARVLGSIMYENLARSVWEMRRSDCADVDELVVGLFHRKMNGGRLQQPFALRIRYDADEQPYRFERVNIEEYDDLQDRLPAGDRLKELLRSGPKSTTDIAESLGLVNVRAALKMLKRRNDVVQFSQGGGRGNAALWGLNSFREEDFA